MLVRQAADEPTISPKTMDWKLDLLEMMPRSVGRAGIIFFLFCFSIYRDLRASWSPYEKTSNDMMRYVDARKPATCWKCLNLLSVGKIPILKTADTRKIEKISVAPVSHDEDCAKTSRDPYRSLKNCGKKREAPEPQRPA